MTVNLKLAQEDSADALLSRDPLALLIGMLLDQQFPMERAFAGPALIAERMGAADRLDPKAIAAYDPEAFVTLFKGPPAVHRYPGSMAARVQALCALVEEQYDGDAAQVWAGVKSGDELVGRLRKLPGFGEQKAKIFAALLGKQLGVRPRGWRAATDPYGDPKARRSIADVVDAGTLEQVRAFKQKSKAEARTAQA